MFITSKQLHDRREARKFMPRFKMEMGKNFVFLVPKVGLRFDEELGDYVPMLGYYADEVFKLFTGETTAPKEVTDANVLDLIEQHLEAKGTAPEELDRIMTEAEKYHNNKEMTDILMISDEYRKVTMIGKKFPVDVSSKSYTDKEGKRHKDLMEVFADMVGKVYRKRAEATVKDLESKGITDEEAVKEALRAVYESKPISNIQDKIVIPVVVIECDNTQMPKVQGKVPLQIIKYECTPNQYSKFKTKLATLSDNKKSYLELNVLFPMKHEKDERVSKMQSAQSMEVSFQPAEGSLFKIDPTLEERYMKFRRDMVYDSYIYTKDSFAFRTVSDDEILASAKKWIFDNFDELDEEIKKEHAELLDLIEETLTPEEIASISSSGRTLKAVQDIKEGVANTADAKDKIASMLSGIKVGDKDINLDDLQDADIPMLGEDNDDVGF